MRYINETKINIYNKNINNKKILFFSDIHYSGIKDINKLNYLYNKIKNMKVDYICISGDIIDNNEAIKEETNKILLIDWFKKISNKGKVLINIGNHDKYSSKNHKEEVFDTKFWDRLNNINNVYVLNNNSYKDNYIYCFGYTQSYDYYYKYKNESEEIMIKEINKYKVNKNIEEDKLNILLLHSPICVCNSNIKPLLNKYDLILTGHMHNGLVLPILDEIFKNNRGIIAPNKGLFPKISRGIKIDKNILIISSGITKLSNMTNILLRWINIFFPIGINIIEISNKKHNITYSNKYYK